MESWQEQIHIGLQTGVIGGLISGFLVALLLKGASILDVILDAIILLAILYPLNMFLYYISYKSKLDRLVKVLFFLLIILLILIILILS